MIEPITDADDCRRIFEAGGYPESWPHDMPAASDNHVVLGAYSPELAGCFPVNFHLDSAEIHVAFRPEYRGQFAIDSAKEAFRWIWDNTNYHTITAYIENLRVAQYAQRCGMKFTGNRYEVSKWAAL